MNTETKKKKEKKARKLKKVHNLKLSITVKMRVW